MSQITEAEFLSLEQTTDITETLECYRLLCPMPVIKTQNALKGLLEGDVLKVICTDPGTMADIPTWSRINEIEVLGYAEFSDHSIQFLLKK